MYKSLSLFGIAALLCSYTVAAQQPALVSLSVNSHVCNTETEIARLAQNEQLQEMARALVEIKPTKYCFILPHAPNVAKLDHQAGYIKFNYKSQILYTFHKYVIATTVAANNP